jgi:threonine synthase
MRCYSTNDTGHLVSLREAVLRGLAPDGGLFMPARLDPLPASFYQAAPRLSFQQIALRMALALVGGDVPQTVLESIVRESFNFEVPLVPLNDRTHVLELFWGPTLAFKDFAARFMARLMSHFVAGSRRELHILVATSGDTGSAVAHGFRSVTGVKVHILFPHGRVSAIQEAQLTAAHGNVTALEVAGTFDDCQRLVKSAFMDVEVRARLDTSSANSINIARLIPQTFYYCWAWAQLSGMGLPIVISVPSGNFGSLTGGLIAKRMGLPVTCFIAATNANDVVPVFLQTGQWREHPVVPTVSNAMDVSQPSNWARILHLYDGNLDRIRADVAACAFDDAATRKAMRELYAVWGYTAEPHGAIGWLGLEAYRHRVPQECTGIFIETAHPSKFPDVIRNELGVLVDIPERAKEALHRPKQSVRIGPDYPEFKEYLLSQDA